ncbi:ABATE domain-containing protein [Kitasatospora sp. GP82]|uniref:CGNR zinc finger domain-containing protein n=1 Tax=Kitasatospora sp. GP82 TaxID=3035089 RepID=UPI0024755898|nr:ABATE domain-containing protein [Kitasatospora sp. GP82]MDH6127946.1 putative RNA-binding Zn ribbon-like protein [Kitasatospora sp. GP82]
MSSPTASAVDDLPLTGESLALDLVNTTFIRGGARGVLVDALHEPADLDRWLRTRLADFGEPLRRLLDGPSGVEATQGHLDRYRELRAALRDLAATTVDGTAPQPATVAAVNAAARLSAGWLELDPDRPGSSVPRWTEPDLRLAALGEIAAAAVALFAGPSAAQVRACPAPGCILYFVKSHSRREWCTSICGNRVRVARHTRRHREPAPGQVGA